jgi:hypothetical protein
VPALTDFDQGRLNQLEQHIFDWQGAMRLRQDRVGTGGIAVQGRLDQTVHQVVWIAGSRILNVLVDLVVACWQRLLEGVQLRRPGGWNSVRDAVFKEFDAGDVILAVKPITARRAFWVGQTVASFPLPQGRGGDGCAMFDLAGCKQRRILGWCAVWLIDLQACAHVRPFGKS